MKLVTVYTALNPAEAQLANSQLEAAGFHSIVVGESAALGMDGYGLTIGGIRVQVPEDEAEDANLLLRSSEASSNEPPSTN
ncbi:MAG: putative prokaryotic signal transducing protein [Verrucomicrobiota bacterium]|jgi:hypothetical protein